MIARRVIPCLDILDGQVVKGKKFEGMKVVGDPIELAKRYSDEGADELVLLDISASVRGERPFYEIVKKVARQVAIPLTVGGGIQTESDIREMLLAGADKVSLNSVLATDPDLLTRAMPWVGSQALVAALDAKRVEGAGKPRWELKVKSGTQSTGEDALEFAKRMVLMGAGELLVTSIDRDGMKSGYDLELLKALSEVVSVPIIASGGAGSKEHILAGLKEGCADAVLAASLFHYGELGIEELKKYLKANGLEVRQAVAS